MRWCCVPATLATPVRWHRSMHPCKQMRADCSSLRLLPQAIDAGTGLLYLHSRNIVHRDGAPQLALVCVPVLFGLSWLPATDASGLGTRGCCRC